MISLNETSRPQHDRPNVMLRLTRRVAMRSGQVVSVALLMALVTAGCEPAQPAADVPASTGHAPENDDVFIGSADDGPHDRSTIELTDATGILDDQGVVRFKIPYRFTSGRPRGYYLVNVAFPGSDHQGGTKPMEAYELKPEGVIVTAFEVGDAAIDAFEVTMSETDSPDQGYTLITETLKGNVEYPSDSAKSEPSTPESEAPAN